MNERDAIILSVYNQSMNRREQIFKDYTNMIVDSFFQQVSGGIRGTVVARWTAGQQVERSILREGNDS